MIELSNIEIDAVSGGLGVTSWLSWGNAIVEFFTGFADGVVAAQQQ